METKTFVVKWLFFVILKLCNGEEKANFRKLERAATRLVPVKSHLRFNETCFNKSLLPVYTFTFIYTCIYIYVYIYIYIYI